MKSLYTVFMNTELRSVIYSVVVSCFQISLRYLVSFSKPQQILKANIRTLSTFISLIDNSTRQLRSFQVVEELVTNKLVNLERETKIISSYLTKIVSAITSVSTF